MIKYTPYKLAIILLACVFVFFIFPASAEERASAFLTIQTPSDLDLHGYMPWGSHVYYGAPVDSRGSFLTDDANVQSDTAHAGALERIYFPVVPGLYHFQVHNYLDRADGNNPYVLQFQLGSTIKVLPGVLGGTNTAKDYFFNIAPSDLNASINGGRQDLHPSTQFALFSGSMYQVFHEDKKSSSVQNSGFSTSNKGSNIRTNIPPNSQNLVGHLNRFSPLGHTAQYLNSGFQCFYDNNLIQALNRIEPAAEGQVINASQVAVGLALNSSTYRQEKTTTWLGRIYSSFRLNDAHHDKKYFKIAETIAHNPQNPIEIGELAIAVEKVFLAAYKGRNTQTTQYRLAYNNFTIEKKEDLFVQKYGINYGLTNQQAKIVWEEWEGNDLKAELAKKADFERIGAPVQINGWADLGLFQLAQTVAINHLDNNEIRQIMAGIKKIQSSHTVHYRKENVSDFVKMFSNFGLNNQQLENLWWEWYGKPKNIYVSSHVSGNKSSGSSSDTSSSSYLANIQPSTGSFTFEGSTRTREDNLEASFAVPVVAPIIIAGLTITTAWAICETTECKKDVENAFKTFEVSPHTAKLLLSMALGIPNLGEMQSIEYRFTATVQGVVKYGFEPEGNRKYYFKRPPRLSESLSFTRGSGSPIKGAGENNLGEIEVSFSIPYECAIRASCLQFGEQAAFAVMDDLISWQAGQDLVNLATKSTKEAKEELKEAKQTSQAASGAPDPDDDDRNPKQDKKLTKGEIKKLKEKGYDAEQIKKELVGNRGSRYDLFKDKKGNIYVKPKNGNGSGEATGININKL